MALSGKAKTDYQREYMRKRRAVRPGALDPVRPTAKQVQSDGIAPKIQHFNPMMVGYEPPR